MRHFHEALHDTEGRMEGRSIDVAIARLRQAGRIRKPLSSDHTRCRMVLRTGPVQGGLYVIMNLSAKDLIWPYACDYSCADDFGSSHNRSIFYERHWDTVTRYMASSLCL